MDMAVRELHDAWEQVLLLKKENEILREKLDEIRAIVGKESWGRLEKR